ncbi:MAG: transcriptional repressor [Nitrospirae bacterium]|nr:transcriptional repressor [Nitrospirota bacterium]
MDKYKEIGLRLTPQRMAILSFLDGNKEHPSAEEIYREVSKRFPHMSFATVYNNLEALKSRGAILELNIDPGRRRYDPETGYHHHLVCEKCKKIIDINANFDLNLTDDQKDGFLIHGNRIEFYGLCMECRSGNGDQMKSIGSIENIE